MGDKGSATKAKFIVEAEDRTKAGFDSVTDRLTKMEAKARKASKGTESVWDTTPLARYAEETNKVGQEHGKVLTWMTGHNNKLIKSVGGGASQMVNFGSKIAGLAGPIGIAVAGIVAIGTAIDYVAEQQYKMSQVSNSMKIDISGARDALGGLVSDYDLAQAANKAYLMGVVDNGEDFKKIASGVSVLAGNMGADVGQMMSDAIEALAKGETDILNNLGIILTQTQAQEEYAKQLGKTVNELNAVEKAEAFRVIGIQKIGEAAEQNGPRVKQWSDQWKAAKIDIENTENEMMGFDARVGKVQEDLRQFSDEDISLLGSTKPEDLEKIRVAFLDVDSSYRDFVETTAQKAGIDLNWDLSAKNAKEELALRRALANEAKQELIRRDKEEAEAKAAIELAEKEAKAKEDAYAIEDAEHMVDVLEAEGATRKEIIKAQIESLELQRQIAEDNDDWDTVGKLGKALELLGIELDNVDKKGGGTTRAERLAAVQAGILTQLQTELEMRKAMSEIMGTSEQDALAFAQQDIDNRAKALEMELEVLEITRAKNKVEKQQNEDRKAEIARQQTLLAYERQLLLMEEMRKAEQETNNAILARVNAQQAAANTANSLAKIERENRIAMVNEEAEMALLSTHGELARKEIIAKKDREIHALKMQGIKEEHAAKMAALQAQEDALLAQESVDSAAFVEIESARKIEVLQHEMTIRQEMAAQAQVLAQQEAQRLQDSLAQMQKISDGVFQIQGQITNIVQTEIGRRREIEDAQFAASQAESEAALQAELAKLDKRIEAAKGNEALQRKLQAQRAKMEASGRSKIEDAEAKHQEKRKRQEMKFAGAQMLIQAAISTVKAISSYPDVVGMGIHAAAAITSTAYGIALLSGMIPNGGSANSGSSAGGSGYGAEQMNQSSGDDLYLTPESMPATQAGETTGAVAQNRSGGNTINGNVTINAWGSVDQDAIEQIAMALPNASYSREAAG